MSRDCCVALPHGVMGLSAVCDCGISCSYSLFICYCNISYGTFGFKDRVWFGLCNFLVTVHVIFVQSSTSMVCKLTSCDVDS